MVVSSPSRYAPAAHLVRDVAVVGAGPIGLAVACELARAGLDVVVVDRRPEPAADAGLRAQLLVARPGDVARLAELGVAGVVAPLDERVTGTLGDGAEHCVEVEQADETVVPDRLEWLVAQSPAALVPIGRLQEALLGAARDAGADVGYGVHITRVTRHARAAGLAIDGAPPLRARLVVVATGAARALVGAGNLHAPAHAAACNTLVAAVFDVGGAVARWMRLRAPTARGEGTALCTVLDAGDASGAGTALLVGEPGAAPASARALQRTFAAVADALGLPRDRYRARPQVFESAVRSVRERVVAGDGRAPVIVAGDAAQTGHVFTGLNAFVNLALASSLCRDLARSGDAIRAGKLGDLTEALHAYETRSRAGAAILRRMSEPYVAVAA